MCTFESAMENPVINLNFFIMIFNTSTVNE